MGANSVEIPVERVEARILPDGPIVNLKPEYIYPVFESTAYADNRPYISTSHLGILFRKRQESGVLVNLSDWGTLQKAMQKNNLMLVLITPSSFDDIWLKVNSIEYNQFTELVEVKGVIEKGEDDGKQDEEGAKG